MPDTFSQAQNDAIDKCRDILGEHFDRYLITVDSSVTDDADMSVCYWKGGYMAALGMAVNASDKIKLTRKTEVDDDNESES